MNRTASYFIIIARTAGGYIAYAPAFPTVFAQASTGRVAYARLKPLIKAQISSLITHDKSIPLDPVFQTRTLRLDLWHLREQEELR